MDSITVEGIHYPNVLVSESMVRQAVELRPRKDDIFVCAYPKTGNHWVRYIIWTIINDESPVIPESKDMDFKLFPFLEVIGTKVAENMASPRTLTIHFPYRLAPKSKEAKYVSIMRNIYDVVVSLYHHFSQMLHYDFDTVFNSFVEGKSHFGNYFEITQSWYERRNEPNVLFLVYEEILQDHAGTIKKIATFMGDKYKEKLEKKPQTLENILLRTSFDYMKKNAPFRLFINNDCGKTFKEILENGRPVEEYDNGFEPDDHINFYHRGKQGTAKGVLTAEQKIILENLVDENIKNPDLAKLMKGSKI